MTRLLYNIGIVVVENYLSFLILNSISIACDILCILCLYFQLSGVYVYCDDKQQLSLILGFAKKKYMNEIMIGILYVDSC